MPLCVGRPIVNALGLLVLVSVRTKHRAETLTVFIAADVIWLESECLGLGLR